MKIISIFGTRPEAIKMAPLCLTFAKNELFIHKILVTGQHREMLDDILKVFNLQPDYDLNVMARVKSLNDLVATVIQGVEEVLEIEDPDLVLVHGDTSTSMAAALASFNRGVQIAHIEAGLRTYDLKSPWPEEGNRQIIGRLSNYHFAPTFAAMDNLIKENISSEQIYLVGNTITDAVKFIADRDLPIPSEIANIIEGKKYSLITCHRRENHGSGINNVCDAILSLASQYPEDVFIWPVHPNPAIKEIVHSKLVKQRNVLLTSPLEYCTFVKLMKNAFMIFSDSGGIQEEAVSLKKNVALLRNNTERPEAVLSGFVKIIGTCPDKIVSVYSKPFKVKNNSRLLQPYGDGRVSYAIMDVISQHA